jgi:hypothetical protein
MQNKATRTLVSLVITLSWLMAMGMLVYKYHGSDLTAAQGPGQRIPRSFFEEQWMGVYMKGEKIGFSSSKLEPLDSGYRLTETLKLKLRVMDTEKDVETSIRASLDENLRLSSFDSSIVSDLDIHVNGRIEANKLIITMETGGSTQSRTIELESVPSLDAVLIRELIREGLREGRKVSLPIIDPTTMSVDEMTMEVTGKEPIMSMGRMQDAYRLKGNLKGIELSVWVSEDGAILREETPLGLTMVRETKGDAMRLGKPSLDIIAETSVPFNLALPLETRYLKVRISDIDAEGLDIDGGRQRLMGDTLEITAERLDELRPSETGEFLEFLKGTMTIQTRDPGIAATAEKIVKGVEDPLLKARLIYDWVYENIAKAPVISIPSATEVLRAKKGDCNEHTILYTALARASGVPTRIAVGLVYKDGSFYYHAWPEVHMDRWVAVDPTLGQFPADATHIRLITGDLDEQTRLYSIIGRIRLEGLGYR